ncbi:MAG: methionyl-tRNA formyltransferase [Rickettsiales bacterium]|jgi:methionyl-tRNA formyltransferase|nr:methionyl-tRNA formyltransferase [Rickettsiales bacterium]
MKIVFFASSEFALPTLRAINNSHHKICAVYTREPKEAGRGMELQNTPIHNEALNLGLEVNTPKTLKKEKQWEKLKKYEADIFVVVAYGLLLPKEILNIAKYSCINIHPSLLPRWRGAAPLQRALMNGDKETGVCVIVLGEGLDDGEILAYEKISITKDTTIENLHDNLSVTGSQLMLRVLEKIDMEQQVKGMPQAKNGLIYADKINKEESKLNFKSVEQNFNIIRTIGGYFEHNGERIKILKSDYEIDEIHKKLMEQKPVANLIENEFFLKSIGNICIENDEMKIKCIDGFLKPLVLQREGKKAMNVKEFVKGFKV